MITQGRVLDVTLDNVGSTMYDDALTGATEINIASAGDFDDNGGQCEILGDVYAYSLIVESEEYDTITIAPGLLQDVGVGEEVNTYPTVQQKVATVQQDDFTADEYDSNSVIEATITPGLAATFEIGDRNDNLGEWVEVDDASGEWVVTKTFGREGKVRGEAIVGPIPTDSLSDGIAPTASPLPTTIGGLKQVFVRWDPIVNPDPVMYEVHVSTSNATPPVAGDTATLVEETAATFIATRVLADGTPLLYNTDGSNDSNPALRQTYYFAVIAKDADGAAAPSAWVSGQIDLTASGDIVAGSVTAELLEAVLALVSEIQVGANITISPPTNVSGVLDGGIEVRNSLGEVIVRLHPDGCFVRGQLVADVLTVLTELQILVSAELSQGAEFELKNKVKDPSTGPTLSQGLTTLQPFPSTLPSGYAAYGLTWDATTGHWYQLIFNSSTGITQLRKISTGGVVVSTTTLAGGEWMPTGCVRGLAIVGSNVFWAKLGGDGTETMIVKNNLATGAYIADNDVTAEPGIYLLGDSSQTGVYLITDHSVAGLIIRRFDATDDVTPIAQTGRSYFPGPVHAGSYYTGGAVIADIGYGASKLALFQWQNDTNTSHRREWVLNLPGFSEDVLTTHYQEVRTNFVISNEYAYHPTYGLVVHPLGSALLQRFSNYRVSSDATWAAKYADTKIADTPDHTTAASPVSSGITVLSRNFVTVTLPPLASGADESDVWVGYGNGVTPATFYKRSETMSGRGMVLTNLKDTSGGTTAPDPGKTLFPSGAAARIFSEVGGLELKGDGLARLPGLEIYHTRGYRTAAHTIPDSTDTNVSFDTWEGSSQNGPYWTWDGTNRRWTIQQSGLYSIAAGLIWASDNVGIRRIRLFAGAFVAGTTDMEATTAGIYQNVTTGIIYLTAGQFVYLAGFQNSGAALSIASASSTWISIARIAGVYAA